MTPLTLSIVPFAVVVGAFLLLRVWLAKQPDQLVARHRGLGVLIWVAALLMVAALIVRFAVPSVAPTGSLGFFMAFLLVFANWQRQRLSRQLHERRDTNAA